MRFARSHVRFKPHVTSRRLAAARRRLERQAMALPLFADQIRAGQPTPEESVAAADRQTKRQFDAHRKYEAESWLKGRRLLRQLPAERRAEIIAAWNASGVPARPEYFLDFLRKKYGLAE
ncbi:MAG: hypothetical protein IPK79_00225 [Vampirovibrionales bacterium]|nr:hypothetical protein [Vampirovibrionales bacterium]